MEPVVAGAHIDAKATAPSHRVEQTGEELLERSGSGSEERMHMMSLRYALARPRTLSQVVSLEDDDSLENLAERGCRQHPGDAPTDDRSRSHASGR
jgi:hypothetical protein